MTDYFLILMIEDLRDRKKISQEEFTYGVIESKQYRKYLDGESKVPFKVLQGLSNKLNIRFEDLMNYFYHYHFEETDKVINLVHFISVFDFESSRKQISNIEKTTLIQAENEYLFNLAKLMYKYYSKEMSKATWIKKLIEFTNYDKLMKGDLLSLAEMYALSELMDASEEPMKSKIASKLKSHITSQTYNDVNILNFIIIQLIKYYNSKNDDATVFNLCQNAIANCTNKKTFYLLDYFYYCLSVCENKRKNFQERDIAIYKCHSAIFVDYNESNYQKFNNLFIIDYGKSLKELINKITPKI